MSRARPSRRAHAAVFLSIFLFAAVSTLHAQFARGPLPLPEAVGVVRIGASGGLERSDDGGVTFHAIAGLPLRVLPADRTGESLAISAFAAAVEARGAEGADGSSNDTEGTDVRDPDTAAPGFNERGYLTVGANEPIIVAVGNRLFASRDGARSFTEIDLTETTNPAAYITALAIDPNDANHWLLGTSYDGLYRSTNAGATWTDLTTSSALWPTHLGAGFFEEVASIHFAPDGSVILQSGYGQGFVRVELDPLRVTRLGPAADGPSAYARAAEVAPVPGIAVPRRSVVLAPWAASLDEAVGTTATGGASNNAARRALADHRTGIYLAPGNATMDKLPGYLDYIERHGFNSVVVDFKDDQGYLTYDSKLELARAAGAVRRIIDPAAIVDAAHARGVYVIARVVVFKDPRLSAYEGGTYAIWDSRLDRPWGVYRTYTDEESDEKHTVQVEAWVDPYSSDVWDYAISVAKEVAAFGVDEIQFDYIRFPSDGRTDDILTRFRPEGADRVQALEGFLSAARNAIDLPIGIDVYGFNAWSRMNYLGQDITRFARYVDVISPMFYPSHFARPFLPQFTYLQRAGIIYDEGTRRAFALANGSAAPTARGVDVVPRAVPASERHTLIRPYVQAFLIGSELDFDDPTYLRYLQIQRDGADRAGSNGYTLWNASGRYYMLP